MSNFAWGTRSLQRRGSVRPELQKIADLAIEMSPFDLTFTEGHRNERWQIAFYAQGRTSPGSIVTDVQWPHGTHNAVPSNAMHLDPYPINYKDTDKYVLMAGVVWAAAVVLELNDHLRWGRDWDRDFDLTDQRRILYFAHFEWVG